MNRGRRSESIFVDKHDYLMFIDLLIEISGMWNVNVAAYYEEFRNLKKYDRKIKKRS